MLRFLALLTLYAPFFKTFRPIQKAKNDLSTNQSPTQIPHSLDPTCSGVSTLVYARCMRRYLGVYAEVYAIHVNLARFLFPSERIPKK